MSLLSLKSRSAATAVVAFCWTQLCNSSCSNGVSSSCVGPQRSVGKRQMSFRAMRERAERRRNSPPEDHLPPTFAVEKGGATSLYPIKSLDQTQPFQPLVVQHALLEERFAAFAKDEKAGKFPKPVAIPFGEWNPAKSKRCGLIGIKVGMTRFWDVHGNMMPCTMLWVPNSQVIEAENNGPEGPFRLHVGAGFNDSRYERPTWRLSASEKSFYDKLGLPVKAVRVSFNVTEDAMLPVGFPLTVRHLVPGQYVYLTSKTKGKGYQGVMKRHHFDGGPASHGHAGFKRRSGSIGTRKGAILKGFKMAGHMGDNTKILPHAYVYHIDFKNDLVYIHGSVHGEKGSYVTMKDASGSAKNPTFPAAALAAASASGGQVPFPSFLPDPAEDLGKLSFSECQRTAPPIYQYHKDYPHPTGGAPMELDEAAARKKAVRAATKRQ